MLCVILRELGKQKGEAMTTKNPILALGSKILRIDWKKNMLRVILRVLGKQKGEAMTTEKSHFSSRFKNSTNWLKREHAVCNTACVREAKGGGDDNGKIPFELSVQKFYELIEKKTCCV